MKILLTGGGTGGHVYPLIAVAQEINKIAEERKLAKIHLHYFSDAAYDGQAFFEQGVKFTRIPAGKLRIYFSFQNFLDLFKTGFGILRAMWQVFTLFPDVVFAKGGYASFPTLMAAKLLGIPVIIHESDSVPGRVTKWAGKFAKFIAVSYPESATFFPADRVAHIGQPVRPELLHPETIGAYEYLGLSRDIPTIFVVGGSTGALKINDAIVRALPELVSKYQVIHQTGKALFDEVKSQTDYLLAENENKINYKPYPFLQPLAMRMAAGVSSLAVTRAGSMLFEIASWALPAIVIPITESQGDHQRKNAYNYARVGAGIVLEESNLTPHLLVSEIDRIAGNASERIGMKHAAEKFFKPDAARKIAEKVLEIGLSHEK